MQKEQKRFILFNHDDFDGNYSKQKTVYLI